MLNTSQSMLYSGSQHFHFVIASHRDLSSVSRMCLPISFSVFILFRKRNFVTVQRWVIGISIFCVCMVESGIWIQIKKNKWKDFLCGVFFCRDRNLEITPILLAWNNPFLKQMTEKIRARLLSILQYIKKYGSEWNETRNFTWPLPCIMLNYFTILLCAKFIKNKSGRLWFSTSSCVLLTPGNPSLVQHLRIRHFLLTCASQWP